MADFLTHLFLPLTAAYVLRRELFESPWALSLAGFGLLPDFDKFLGVPGLLHSLLTLVPLCLGLLAAERWWRGELSVTPVIVALVLSHLLLDFLYGGPVPLLYPFAEAGIGLHYPARTVFGVGPLGVAIENSLVALRVTTPSPGFNTYGFIRSGGVGTMLLFGVVYWGLERDGY